ncbi:hypothetical protein [Streptococcus suis]|uniref:hypothetical protein n=1 Tax=Streptococcus suis TaxID=1307 RepID=UPI001ABED09C|nr:hypothetical protein [Streptococcus suis]MBO4112847.1 hypothetical protein [Streptococcus suis]
MNTIRLRNGYLEVWIEKNPRINFSFIKNDIICFRMFRNVGTEYFESVYKIDMTKYMKWYGIHKQNQIFLDIEKRAYSFAQLLYTAKRELFLPNISCEQVNVWFGVFADNKNFIKHGKESLVK